VTVSNPRDIAKFPGKLCVNPTDLALPFPHGGTGLGVVRNVIFRTEVSYEKVIAEEYGQVVEAIGTEYGCVLAASLISFDEEALKELFWNTEVGSVSGRRGVSEGASPATRAGFLLSSRSVVLLFSPDDTGHAPALLIRRALPMLEPSAQANLQLNSDIAIAVTFTGIRDTTGRLFEWRPLKDITL